MLTNIRVGHSFLVGKTTLETYTVIDINTHNRVFQVVDLIGRVIDSFCVDHKDLFAHYENGIDQAETQDTEGRCTVEGGGQAHLIKWDCGQKVESVVELKGATLKVKGYIIRNYWNDYYLISEQGVSIPGRYWKVAHSKCSKVI